MLNKNKGSKLLILCGLAGAVALACQAEIVINRPLVEQPKTVSEQNNDDIGFTLSAAYDSYQRKDYESAYQEFDFFVKRKDMKAMMANAYLLSSGYASRDFQKATEYLRVAASLKYARAVYLQGLLEKYKQGGRINLASERLINQAAVMGDYVAANALANYHFEKGNYALAQRWNEQAVSLGSVAARKNQSIIFNRTEHSASPVAKTVASAAPNQGIISELRTRSQSGDANASYDLAVRYHKGAGVAVNFGEAIRLYQLAAKQGSAEARKVLPILISKRTTGGNLNSMWMQEMSNMLPNPVVVSSNTPHSGLVKNDTAQPSHEYLDVEKGAAAVHILEEDDPLDGLLRLTPNR